MSRGRRDDGSLDRFDDFERRFLAMPPAPGAVGRVRGITVRVARGQHETPARVRLTVEGGVEGDRWAAGEARRVDQVTLMEWRVAELVADGRTPPHRVGDNFLVELDLAALRPGARLALGSATIEITPEPHAACKIFSSRFGQDAVRWINGRAHRERNLRGLRACVVSDGEVALGDPIRVLP
jgi:MOSC domain-containing protein YiiM